MYFRVGRTDGDRSRCDQRCALASTAYLQVIVIRNSASKKCIVTTVLHISQFQLLLISRQSTLSIVFRRHPDVLYLVEQRIASKSGLSIIKFKTLRCMFELHTRHNSLPPWHLPTERVPVITFECIRDVVKILSQNFVDISAPCRCNIHFHDSAIAIFPLQFSRPQFLRMQINICVM